MLREVCVRNIALIDELRMEFLPGLNVLTGETGVGKSLLIGALSLLLGGRASASQIRSGAKDASVDGVFEPSGEDLRDELNAILGAAVTYARKPRCSETLVAGCSDQVAVDQLAAGLSAADASLDAVGASLVAARQFCEGEHPDVGDARTACLSARQGNQMLALSSAIAGLGALQAILLAEANKGG